MPDADGYPTDEELGRIRAWPWTDDMTEWFAFIRTCWWMPEWGWSEHEAADPVLKRSARRYDISTGGWSGNEDIIAAMVDNWMLWTTTWCESRRGGHYVFLVPRPKAAEGGA